MSGGVDSSVAAYLLQQQGYEIIGLFMKNWSDNSVFSGHNCPWQQDQADARQVAALLKIPLYTLNFEQEYRTRVVDYFLAEYQQGRTPNPDIKCNQEIKFKVFFAAAEDLGVDYIAFGHYARVKHFSRHSELYKGVDSNKDQSYFLYSIDQSALQKTLFPIGELTKPEVRQIARRLNLPVKDKPDSQGICFVGEIDLRKFLQRFFKEKPGKIIEQDSGQVVGEHQGLAWYTIGQRKGVGVGGTGLPVYVSGKDLKKNELYVVKGNYNPKLFQPDLTAIALRWINLPPPLPGNFQVKIRYRQPDQKCQVEWVEKNQSLRVFFEEKQRAITPGQSVVIYEQEKCWGGGIIQ